MKFFCEFLQIFATWEASKLFCGINLDAPVFRRFMPAALFLELKLTEVPFNWSFFASICVKNASSPPLLVVFLFSLKSSLSLISMPANDSYWIDFYSSASFCSNCYWYQIGLINMIKPVSTWYRQRYWWILHYSRVIWERQELNRGSWEHLRNLCPRTPVQLVS